jgi:3-hydroxyethyl bacteriochlorophyllide a dehydrogenase
MKARAVVFESPRTVDVREVNLPEAGENDVLVKTLVSGVSVGTERWALLGKRAEIGFPNVPGYMGVGEILELGDGAAGLDYHKGGLVYFGCSRMTGEFKGKSWMSTHMSHAVVDVVSPRANPDFFSCEPVPEGAQPEDVVLAALCGVSMRGIEMATVPAAQKVLVVGLGVLGQYAAQVCRLKGALVAAADVVDLRLAVARDLGAEWVIDAANENIAARASEIAPGGFDIVIDTSSKAEVVNSLWPLVKTRGKLVFQGWYPPPTPLNLDAAHGRMPTAYFPCSHSGPAVAAAMRWMRDGRIDTRRLVTHTKKPDEARAVYEMILAGSEDFLGVCFDWRG